MRFPVKRTVSLIAPESDKRFGQEGLSLSDFESDHSYVVLGEPGMGKSTEFKMEADRIGTMPPIPARRFIRGKPKNHPEWKNGPLFIDGLDEVRAAGGDPKKVIDKIIVQLEDLDIPQFRLSCRSGSWLGIGDQEELDSLSNSRNTLVLQLNPLNHSDIRQILSQRCDQSDTFITKAYERRLEVFLSNPQLLDLLIKSVNADGWPDNPSAVFEHACQELLKEQNREHRDAHSDYSQPSRDAVLTTAGQLFALILITGKGGCSRADTDDPDTLSLLDVEDQDRTLLHAAFNSRLFEGHPSDRTPIHRLLAEYLGARYLDDKIRRGLSVRRVFALLMGHDGIPFPDLRGMAGWLAALNPQARATLIHADPIAVAFNGDASSFKPEERRQLLENLERSIDSRYTWPSAAALGALAGNQGISVIWELANSHIRSKNRQGLIYMLLCGVSQMSAITYTENEHFPSTHLEDDRKKLLEIIYESRWKSNVRCEALRALNKVLTGSPNRGLILRRLIKDLDENSLPDHGNDLRGTVLHLLYPGELHPEEVWDYLVPRLVPYQYDIYLEFWSLLIERSQEEQVRELLDSLCNRASEVLPKLARHRLANTVLTLLARGLDLFGDELSIEELYRWFGLVEFDIFFCQLIPKLSSDQSYGGYNHDANTAIRNWLSEREATQRALIEHGVLMNQPNIGNKLLNKTVGLKFIGEDAPPGFRSWCLARAIELWDSEKQSLAKELAFWSIRHEEGWGEPLSDDEVAQQVSEIPGLREWNDLRLQNKAQADLKEAKWKKKPANPPPSRFDRRKQQALKYLPEHKKELAEGRCHPDIFRDLARIYFYALDEAGSHPRDSLQSYLDGDQSLARTTLAGFRNLLKRDDLPELEQITEAYGQGKSFFLALPFLAGIEEEERETGDVLNQLSEKGKRRALGFYLITDVPHQRHAPFPLVYQTTESNLSKWYKKALKFCPEAVSDSLVAIHNACVRSKSPPNQHLFKMAFDEAYTSVAELSVRKMFTVFPTRCTSRQLEFLRIVLWAAILTQGMSDEELKKLALRRLKRKKMDIGQRSQWLCAGLFVAQDTFLPLLTDFLASGDESRIRHIMDFFEPTRYRHSRLLTVVNDWQSQEISHLLQILGEQTKPPNYSEWDGLVSNKQMISEHVEILFTSWIQELSKRIDDDSAQELDSLVSNPDLSVWESILLRAQDDQTRLRREANQPNLDLKQIQKTLQNGPPSSAADLTSITVDTLEKLANDIRNENTSDWRQYWHWDQKTGKPANPQNENYCRDALLSDLKRMLEQHQIDAQPEGQYADDKRADIRVSFGSNLAIPIEIKKNSHLDVWRGISEQLVPKYTRDPKADGNGIYLAFWFGAEYMKIVPPRGVLPSKPEELKNLLQEGLDPILRNKIHVVVVDVSPDGKYT